MRKSQNIGSGLSVRWKKKIPSKGLRNAVVNLYPQNVNDYFKLVIQVPRKSIRWALERQKGKFLVLHFNIRETWAYSNIDSNIGEFSAEFWKKKRNDDVSPRTYNGKERNKEFNPYEEWGKPSFSNTEIMGEETF